MNGSTTLTDRYIAAAMRTVPEQQRADLAAELRASIDDQIDARVEQGESRDAAERVVLTEFGDPDVLAAGYTDRRLYLIGPRLYLVWWRLLKLLLCIVLPLGVAGITLGQLIAGASIGAVIGSAVVGALSIAVHLCFWVTLVFALLERAGSGRPRGALPEWSLDHLPEPRPVGVGVADLVVTLVFLAAAAVAVLWDQLIGFVRIDGAPLPILSPGLWPWWIAGLLALIVAEAIFAVVLFRTRRWTKELAFANALIALSGAVPALYLLSQNALLNEAFFTTVIPEDSAAEVYSIVSILTGFAIVVIAGWNIVDGIVKTWRMSRSAAAGMVQGF
ncbi:permease prefix domain 1-containing protein [Microbacterium deminutum]|uniref:Permease prefix domain 1-containing protein n=1 Tax=Microbacterium deminutum TaxID=344164 RepID=A0ABP5CCS1_9MICO